MLSMSLKDKIGDLSMRNEIYEGIIDLIDETYDYVLFDNDTKKIDIKWFGNGYFAISLYYKDTDIEEDEWDDDWVEQECWYAYNFFENYSELFLGEVNVIEQMTNEIMDYIKG